MLVVITGALVETLVKHMFSNYLDEKDKIEIGGAPSWYMMPVENEMCTFAHKSGGMDMIDFTKDQTKIKMAKKINDIIEITIYDNTKNVKNIKEKSVIEAWKIDSNLPVFVKKHINYSRVSYEDEIQTTFVRGCISNDTIISYQKERLEQIKQAVLNAKANNAFDELDSDLQVSPNPNNDDPFSELPKF